MPVLLCSPPGRMDPLWNSLVVGGFYDGKPFLGTVGMIGTNYTDAHLATGAWRGRVGQPAALALRSTPALFALCCAR